VTPDDSGTSAAPALVVPDPGLDPVIHAPARLRIIAALAAVPERDAIAFTRLQQLLDLTAGNLTTHLRRLEDAGYVLVVRLGQGRTAQTSVSITPAGRAALVAYRSALAAILG